MGDNDKEIREDIINILKSRLRFYNNTTIKADYLIFTLVRRHINKFISSGKINQNLLFNYIIILNNKYSEDTYNIFKLLLSPEKLAIINPFFVFLGLIDAKDIQMNEYIIDIILQFASDNYIFEHYLTGK